MTKAVDRTMLLVIFCTAFEIAAFILDVMTPAEVAIGVLYAIIVLAGLWFPRQRRAILTLAVVSTVLAVLGLAPAMPELEWQVVTNRSFAILAIWAIALAVLRERTLSEAVREGENRYQALIEVSPDAIYIHRDGTIIVANQRAAELFAAPVKQLIGRSVFELVDEASLPQARARTAALTAPGMLAGLVELTFRRLDGTSFPVEVTAAAVLLHGQLAIQVVLRDVSERKRTEARMRESQALLQATFNAVPIPLAVSAIDRTILMWNPAAERVFGYRADEIIGRRYVDLMHNEDQERAFTRNFEHALAGNSVVAIAAKRTARNGQVVDLSFSCVPIQAEEGAIPAVVYVLEDMTQKNATESQLRQAQKMEAIGNLTGGLAHDFNNLMTVIVGNLEMAAPLVARNTEASDLIRNGIAAAWSGANLTQQLLAFARQQPLQSAPVALNELIEDTARLLGRTLIENIEISLHLTTDVVPVMADETQLQAALVNLATNARDAMPRGGRLTITTGNRQFTASEGEVVPGDYALIEVSDTGTGMTPEVLEHLFEPFFTTKERSKGTGLGLSMVFGFVKQSGGHITVDSELGVGTTFSLHLPRADGKPTARGSHHTPAPPAVGGNETILVVEDNVALRHVSARRIEALGYRVFKADGPSAALACLATERIDLLFTDVVMPGDMDGLALVQQAVVRWPMLKVILTSGSPELNLYRNAETAGRRMLSKPYRTRELAVLLREVLEHRHGDDLSGDKVLEQRGPTEIGPAVAVLPSVLALPQPSGSQGHVLVVDDDQDVSRIVAAFLRKAGFNVTSVEGGNEALAKLGPDHTFHALVTDFAMPGMSGADLVLQARELHPTLPALVITGYAGAEGMGQLPSDVMSLRKPFQRDALVHAVKLLVEGATLE